MRATSTAAGSPSGHTLSSVMNRSANGDARPSPLEVAELGALAGDVVDDQVEQHVVPLGEVLDVRPAAEPRLDLEVASAARTRGRPRTGTAAGRGRRETGRRAGRRAALRGPQVAAQRIRIGQQLRSRRNDAGRASRRLLPAPDPAPTRRGARRSARGPARHRSRPSGCRGTRTRPRAPHPRSRAGRRPRHGRSWPVRASAATVARQAGTPCPSVRRHRASPRAAVRATGRTGDPRSGRRGGQQRRPVDRPRRTPA